LGIVQYLFSKLFQESITLSHHEGNKNSVLKIALIETEKEMEVATMAKLTG